MHDTQGDALGYEQVGLTGRSLSEWVFFYVVAKINPFNPFNPLFKINSCN
jgi:hypothetical protein